VIYYIHLLSLFTILNSSRANHATSTHESLSNFFQTAEQTGASYRVATYVIDVEGLADADSDEGLGAEALHGEGHAARRDVADRTERLEDPHPLSLSSPVVEPLPRRRLQPLLSPLLFLGFGKAGEEAGAARRRRGF